MHKIYSLPTELYDAAVKSGLQISMDAYIREIGFPSCKYVNSMESDSAYWEFNDYDIVWFVLRWM